MVAQRGETWCFGGNRLLDDVLNDRITIRNDKVTGIIQHIRSTQEFIIGIIYFPNFMSAPKADKEGSDDGWDSDATGPQVQEKPVATRETRTKLWNSCSSTPLGLALLVPRRIC